jgi:hypothetical protein
MAGKAARVAVERSGRLPRYKPVCLHIEHRTSNPPMDGFAVANIAAFAADKRPAVRFPVNRLVPP